jgi:hypothetical protein
MDQVSILILTPKSKAFIPSSSPFSGNYFQDRVTKCSSFGGCVPLLLELMVDRCVSWHLQVGIKGEDYVSSLVRTAYLALRPPWFAVYRERESSPALFYLQREELASIWIE